MRAGLSQRAAQTGLSQVQARAVNYWILRCLAGRSRRFTGLTAARNSGEAGKNADAGYTFPPRLAFATPLSAISWGMTGCVDSVSDFPESLPVEKVFAVGDLCGGAPGLGELGPDGVLADGVGGVDAVGAAGAV